ncbi:MAG: hypothetical protein ACLT12_08205 [Lactococcus lactis]
MKKSFFMKIFNIVINNFIISLFSALLAVFLHYLSIGIQKNSFLMTISLFNQLANFANLISFYSLHFTLVFTLVNAILISIEIKNRISNDSIANLGRSIKATFNIRKFMAQHQNSEKTKDNLRVTTVNPINETYNKAVRKNIVDITNEHLTLFIKVPRSQQSAKILREMEVEVKEEIVTQNPDFIISTFQADSHHHKWLRGNKRN